MIEFAVKQEKSFEKIVVLVKSIIQELIFSKMFSFFGASFSRERKSERIERKFKTQNPIQSGPTYHNASAISSNSNSMMLHNSQQG